MTTAAPAQPPPPRPAVMGPYRPDWMEKPSGDDLAAFYPAHAARNNISGKATITCKVMADGRLNACVIKDENPPGEHFGEAALKIAPKFRMIPPDDPNAPPADVTVPLVFDVPKLNVMIRPSEAEDARFMTQLGAGVASVATVLLVMMIWALGRYNNRAAKRSAEKP